MENFYILIHSLTHFSQIIKYPECKDNGVRKLEKWAELLSLMTECHHGLHNGFIAYLLNIGESTLQRISVACVLFMEAVNSKNKPKTWWRLFYITCLKYLAELDLD